MIARPWSSVILAALLVGAGPVTPGEAPADSSGFEDRGPIYEPGVLVVKFRWDASVRGKSGRTGFPSVDGLLQDVGTTDVRPLLPPSILSKARSLDRFYLVSYESNVHPVRLAARLSADPAVEYAEPKYIHWLDDLPNDPLYDELDHLTRVDAENAWDVVKGESGEVVIAIVDGGTDWRHVDLQRNVWTNPNEIEGNGIDDDGNGFVDDIRGWNFPAGSGDPTGLVDKPESGRHGTHVAGIAAAVTDNGVGVSSISWNARFMAVNTANPRLDGAISFGYEGIAYAALTGADIINCSWGRSGHPSRFEQEMVEFAFEQGSLVVAAAGNSGRNADVLPHFPGAYPRVLSVGATYSQFDLVAEFTNFGATVDSYAPGVSIHSTTPAHTYDRFFTGTSMSSPIVAGIVALLKTHRPDMTADQLREQIRVTGDPLIDLNPSYGDLIGSGRANAFRAVTDFSRPSVRVLDVNVMDEDGDGRIAAGEAADVTLTFINHLTDSPGLSVSLSTSDPNATLLSTVAEIEPLESAATATATFALRAGSPPLDYRLPLYLDLTGDGYDDRDFFTVTLNPSQTLDHDTGVVQTTLTTEGNIGAVGLVDRSPGVGFVHDGRNFLFEAGLMIGTSDSTVSDCVRGEGDVQESDFRPAGGSRLTMTTPGARADEEGSITLVDSAAANPLGITVRQRSYASKANDYNDFIIFRYTIRNDNEGALTGIHAGLFVDWDMNDGSLEWARFNPLLRMAYSMDAPSQARRLAATVLLQSDLGLSYRTVDNEVDLFDGAFTGREKWIFMSQGVDNRILGDRDLSSILAAGPFDLAAGDSIDVSFALIGASSLAELEASAARAIAHWEFLATATETPIVPEVLSPRLDSTYPNPFTERTRIGFFLPEPAVAQINIYNILGQHIATAVDRPFLSGHHEVTISRSDLGDVSGVYFYALETRGRRLVGRLVLTQ